MSASKKVISQISVAPMMDWTDRHCRYFHRSLSQHAILYTEMITTGALIHGDVNRFLQFDETEHPVVLQLGGCDPKQLSQCAKLVADHGYDGVNLNVGCPSDRVQSARFGACLMAAPDLVADCIKAMQDACDIPVTVKTRIGIDEHEGYNFLCDFVKKISGTGCETIIIHARKAWLQGLSPKQNREIPPLHYDRVYQIKKDFPNLKIIINGGIKILQQADDHLKHVDGVMLGRLAYQAPYTLAEIDQRYYQSQALILTRQQIIEKMVPYIEQQLSLGTRLHTITRHMLGLFNGQPGARHWRRTLSELGNKKNAGIEVIEKAIRTC